MEHIYNRVKTAWAMTVSTKLMAMPRGRNPDAALVVEPQHLPLYVTLFIFAATSKTDPLKLPTL